MAPVNKLKTYERKKQNTVNKSVDVFDALFAKNLTKRFKSRRKQQIRIKDLPENEIRHLINDSFSIKECSDGDSFDRLRNGKIYNKVKLTDNVNKINSSESDASKSKSCIKVSFSFHSPVISRRKQRKKAKPKGKCEETDNAVPPINIKDSSLNKPIEISLEIEKVAHKVDYSSLSYIKLPEIKEKDVSQAPEVANTSQLECSYYTNWFANKNSVHASTPLVPPFIKPNEAVRDDASDILLEKSYEEIKKWGHKFPNGSLNSSSVTSTRGVSESDYKSKLRTMSVVKGKYKLTRSYKVDEEQKLEKSQNSLNSVNSNNSAEKQADSFVKPNPVSDRIAEIVQSPFELNVNRSNNVRISFSQSTPKSFAGFSPQINRKNSYITLRRRIISNSERRKSISYDDISKSLFEISDISNKSNGETADTMFCDKNLIIRLENCKNETNMHDVTNNSSLVLQNEDDTYKISNYITKRTHPGKIFRRKTVCYGDVSRSLLEASRTGEIASHPLVILKNEDLLALKEANRRSQQINSEKPFRRNTVCYGDVSRSLLEASGTGEIASLPLVMLKNEDLLALKEAIRRSQQINYEKTFRNMTECYGDISRNLLETSRTSNISRNPLVILENEDLLALKEANRRSQKINSRKICRRTTVCYGDVSRSLLDVSRTGEITQNSFVMLENKDLLALKEANRRSQQINSVIKDLIVVLDNTSFRHHENESNCSVNRKEKSKELIVTLPKLPILCDKSQSVKEAIEISSDESNVDLLEESSFNNCNLEPSRSDLNKIKQPIVMLPKLPASHEMMQSNDMFSDQSGINTSTEDLSGTSTFNQDYCNKELVVVLPRLPYYKMVQSRNRAYDISSDQFSSEEDCNEASTSFDSDYSVDSDKIEIKQPINLLPKLPPRTMMQSKEAYEISSDESRFNSLVETESTWDSAGCSAESDNMEIKELIVRLPKLSNYRKMQSNSGAHDISSDQSEFNSPVKNTSVTASSVSNDDIKQATDVFPKTKHSLRKSARISSTIEVCSSIDIDICDNSTANNTDCILVETPKAQPLCNLSDIVESSYVDDGYFVMPHAVPRNPVRKTLQLKPGKFWRRSLSISRKSIAVEVLPEESVRHAQISREKLDAVRESSRFLRRNSIKIVRVTANPLLSRDISILENYAQTTSYVSNPDIDVNLENSLRGLSLSKRKTSFIRNPLPVVTARDIVLRRCGQVEPLPFETCYSKSVLQNCHKIGEGVYGEVFLYKNQNGGMTVMKVIPIEGDLLVNGERQKKFEEILSEIIISMELSNLRYKKKNVTSSFTEVQKILCVQGCYPDWLLESWELYEETRGTENDSPEIFASDQLYIVLELANGGKDLEAFVMNNALQAYAMFQQVACGLAVAEVELNFEHRDLHWGNVLLSSAEKKKLNFCIDGKNIEISTHGIEVAIIDFTLSRIEYDGVVIFNDLSEDPDLFTAEGDYQFEIYKLMQNKNGNAWQHFEPYTNILWLHYILDKAITALRYRNKKSKIHKEYINKLTELKDCILSYSSVKDFVLSNFI